MEFLGEPDETAFRNASESAGKWFHAINRLYTRFPDRPDGDVTPICLLLENLRLEVVTHGPVIRRHESAILEAASNKGTPAFQFGLNIGTVWTSAHFAALEETESLLRDIYYLVQPFAEDRSEVDLYREMAPGQLKPLYQEILTTLSLWVSWHEPLPTGQQLEDWIRIEALALLPKPGKAKQIPVNTLMLAHIAALQKQSRGEKLLSMTIEDWRDFLAPKRNGAKPSVSTVHDTTAWRSLQLLRAEAQAERGLHEESLGRTGSSHSMYSDDDDE